jgi:nucleoside-diphosphate-sugar epimerase
MRILFIGGTGIISTACTQLAVSRGLDLTLLNRGQRPPIRGARQVVADISNHSQARAALGNEIWDVVVDFISFTPAEIESRLQLLRGRVRQYIFISSASAYQKPVTDYLVTESTPLANPFWDYSRNKLACVDRLQRALREEAFPVTIIRPSFTYGVTVIPLPMNSWSLPYTAIDRLRRGAPVIIPGDGTPFGHSRTMPISRRVCWGCSDTRRRSATRFTSPRTRCSIGTRFMPRSRRPPA